MDQENIQVYKGHEDIQIHKDQEDIQIHKDRQDLKDNNTFRTTAKTWIE